MGLTYSTQPTGSPYCHSANLTWPLGYTGAPWGFWGVGCFGPQGGNAHVV